jgi:hypothetical protein
MSMEQMWNDINRKGKEAGGEKPIPMPVFPS